MRNYHVPIFNFLGHIGKINSVCVTSSNHIIFAVEDQTIRIWDMLKKKLIHIFHSVNKETKYLSLSSDEKYFIAGDTEGYIELWDLHTKTRLDRILAYTETLTTVFFSSKENIIISAGLSDDYLIEKHIIDKTGKLKKKDEFFIEEEISYMGTGIKNDIIFVLGKEDVIQLKFKSLKFDEEQEHDNMISMFFSECNKYLIGIDTENILKIWMIKKLKQIYEKQLSDKDFTSGVTMVRYLEDNNQLIYGDSSHLKVIDMNNDNLLYEVKAKKIKGIIDSIQCFVISPSKHYLILGSDNYLRIIERKTGESLQSIKRKPVNPPYFHDYELSEISQDGKYLVGIRRLVEKAQSRTVIEVWNMLDLSKIHEIFPKMDAENDITTLRISPNSKFFVTGDNAKKTGGFIWNMKTGKQRRKLKELDYGVNSIFITKDSTMIITSDATFDIEVFDAKTGKLIKRVSSSTKNVSAFAMTKDNEILVSSFRDVLDQSADIKIWDFESGEIITLLKTDIDFKDRIIWLGFTSDDEYLLVRSKIGHLITYERKNWKLISNNLISDQHVWKYSDDQFHCYPLAENIILKIPENIDIPSSIQKIKEKWANYNSWISLSDDSYFLRSEVDDQMISEANQII